MAQPFRHLLGTDQRQYRRKRRTDTLNGGYVLDRTGHKNPACLFLYREKTAKGAWLRRTYVFFISLFVRFSFSFLPFPFFRFFVSCFLFLSFPFSSFFPFSRFSFLPFSFFFFLLSLSFFFSRNSGVFAVFFYVFLRFVDKIAPTWFVFENVYGLTKFKNGEENIQNHIENRFRDIGYTVKSKILYASDFGVPQRRNRLFIVGNRNGIDFEFPKEFDYSVSVDEAISDLPVLGNGEIQMKGEYTVPFEQASPYAQLMRKKSKAPTQNIVSRNKDYVVERYKYIGQGENWSSIPDRLMENYADKKRCHSGIYKRLIGGKPSVVISNYRKSMLIHPHQDRGLSVREAARLQSFPDHFIFEGPVSYVQQQIGNAVPPLLAKAVMKKILTYK